MNPQSRLHLDAGAHLDCVQLPPAVDRGLTPRLLTPAQTAAYLGYKSAANLSRLPIKPLTLGPRTAPRYDKRHIDRWLDGLSDLNASAEPETELDEAEIELQNWRMRRVARTA